MDQGIFCWIARRVIFVGRSSGQLWRASLSVSLGVGFVLLLFFASFWSVAEAAPLETKPLQPKEIKVGFSKASGNDDRRGTSAADAFVDDVFIEKLTFGDGFFTAAKGQFATVAAARVVSEHKSVNAEFGDRDSDADGNPNPFVSSGLAKEGQPIPLSLQESTDPSIQNAAIRAALGSFSLTQGIDGEAENYVVDLLFGRGIVDSHAEADLWPELIFAERGANSDFRVELITGLTSFGDSWNPELHSQAVDIFRKDLWLSPYFIDTTEIQSGQRLGFVGLDLSDFSLPAKSVVYGVRVTSLNNSGADLHGIYLTARSTSQFRDPILIPEETKPDSMATVPEPATWLLMVGGLSGLVTFQTRRRSRTTLIAKDREF
jgi:hypothetical protein